MASETFARRLDVSTMTGEAVSCVRNSEVSRSMKRVSMLFFLLVSAELIRTGGGRRAEGAAAGAGNGGGRRDDALSGIHMIGPEPDPLGLALKIIVDEPGLVFGIKFVGEPGVDGEQGDGIDVAVSGPVNEPAIDDVLLGRAEVALPFVSAGAGGR